MIQFQKPISASKINILALQLEVLNTIHQLTNLNKDVFNENIYNYKSITYIYFHYFLKKYFVLSKKTLPLQSLKLVP